MVCYVIAFLFAVYCIFPFYIIVTTALKNDREIFAWPPVWQFHPTLANFYDALFVFGGQGAGTFILNSIIITGASTVLSLVLGSMAAYGLARFKFRGRRQLAFWILSTRFAPPIAFAVPMYLMVLQLDLLDTHIALVLIYTSMNLSLVIWLLRGFFAEIPIEIEEAALVDGYTRLQIFFRIALPLVRPGIITAGVLASIFSWNEFLFALTLTQTDNMRTVPVGLTLLIGQYNYEWNQIMAMSVLGCLPVIVLFLIFQRHFVSGLSSGAVKT